MLHYNTTYYDMQTCAFLEFICVTKKIILNAIFLTMLACNISLLYRLEKKKKKKT